MVSAPSMAPTFLGPPLRHPLPRARISHHHHPLFASNTNATLPSPHFSNRSTNLQLLAPPGRSAGRTHINNGAEQAPEGAGRGEGPDEHRARQGRVLLGAGRGHRQGHQALRELPSRRAPHPRRPRAHAAPLLDLRRVDVSGRRVRGGAVQAPRAHPELGRGAQGAGDRAPAPGGRRAGVRAGALLRHAPGHAHAQHVRLLRPLPPRLLGLLGIRAHLRGLPRRPPRVPDAGTPGPRRQQPLLQAAQGRALQPVPRENTRGSGRRNRQGRGARAEGHAGERDDAGAAPRQGPAAAAPPGPLHRLPPSRRGEDEPGGDRVAVPAGEGERAAVLRADGGHGGAHRAVPGHGGGGRLRARPRRLLRPRQADRGARRLLRLVQGRLRLPPVRRPGGGARHAQEARAHGRVRPRQARRRAVPADSAAAAVFSIARAAQPGARGAACRGRGRARHGRHQGPSATRCGAGRSGLASAAHHRGSRRGGGLLEPEGGRHVRGRARAAACLGSVRRQPADKRTLRPVIVRGLGDGIGRVGERAGQPARGARRRPRHAGPRRHVQPRDSIHERAGVLREREQRGSAAARGAHAGAARAPRDVQRRRRPLRGVYGGAAAGLRADVRHADEAAASDGGADGVAAVRQERHAGAEGAGNAAAAAAAAAVYGS